MLRVLTLNCWNVSEPLDARMAIVRRGVAELRPDVAAFQEVVVRRDGFDQGVLLLDGIGYARAFGPAFSWSDDGIMVPPHEHTRVGFGNLIASRWPILRSEVRRLPGREGDEPRTVLGVIIQSPDGNLPVLTTHLDCEADHGWVRERQVQVVDDFARDLAAEAHLPAIVMGDFNAHPDSAEIRYLRGLSPLDGRRTCFQDAWEIGGPGGHGHTWDNRNRFATLDPGPDGRLDYIFVGAPDGRGRGAIVSARLVFEDPTGDVFASDHFGLFAEIDV
ncbi:MAG TPA: endonuclease/exonuclease/phosphatase family protein [Candidatus Eisenbacteria bacterium]|nr:endonuclease/exonuclease/phosphatase family protein [Candidatus Eisenbacteria bacterium]